MRYRSSRAFSAALVFIITLAAFSACQRPDSDPAATASPTPTVTPFFDQTQTAPHEPQNPYQQYAPGLLARTVYKAEPTERFAVEMWDLLVGPGKKSEAASLPGGAVFEVRSGTGVITVGGQRRDIKIGATFNVDEGASFQLENSETDNSLSIRVVLIHSPRS